MPALRWRRHVMRRCRPTSIALERVRVTELLRRLTRLCGRHIVVCIRLCSCPVVLKLAHRNRISNVRVVRIDSRGVDGDGRSALPALRGDIRCVVGHVDVVAWQARWLFGGGGLRLSPQGKRSIRRNTVVRYSGEATCGCGTWVKRFGWKATRRAQSSWSTVVVVAWKVHQGDRSQMEQGLSLRLY
jgi:hypothetical protein